MVFVAKEYLVAVGTDTLLIMTDVAVTAANVKNQRTFEYLRLSNKEPTKNNKCKICEHRNDCVLRED